MVSGLLLKLDSEAQNYLDIMPFPYALSSFVGILKTYDIILHLHVGFVD